MGNSNARSREDLKLSQILRALLTAFSVICVILSIVALATIFWKKEERSVHTVSWHTGLLHSGYDVDLNFLNWRCEGQTMPYGLSACTRTNNICRCSGPIVDPSWSYQKCVDRGGLEGDCEKIKGYRSNIKGGGMAALIFFCLGLLCIVAACVACIVEKTWLLGAILFVASLMWKMLGLIIWGATHTNTNFYFVARNLSLGYSSGLLLASFFVLLIPTAIAVLGFIRFEHK
eukprot:Platyproteum_vivax@DN4852_c0_g1_i1.p1